MLEPIVAGQIAICLVLLAATAALLLQLLHLRSRHVGFRGVHVLPMRLFLAERYGKNAERLGRYQDAVVTRVGSLPGVEQAAFVSYLPTGDSGRRPFVGVGTGRELSGNLLSATPSTFEILGIPIERGRDFKAGDGAVFGGVVIAGSSLAASAWPNQGPVGRHILARAVSEEPVEAIGVVGDVGVTPYEDGDSDRVPAPSSTAGRNHPAGRNCGHPLETRELDNACSVARTRRCYSSRSTLIGSSLDAFQAGRKPAIVATPRSTSAMTRKAPN